MRQMLLDLPGEKPQNLDNFEPGRNAELLALLSQHAYGDKLPLSERFVYCWGEAGAGKTHLLHALVSSGGTRLLTPNSPPSAFIHAPDISLYLLDDCERLSDDMQIAAFALFNQIREHGGALISSGALPPARLALREDLRTRLGWGLIYQVHGLTDDEKIAALTQAAKTRGFTLATGVLPYLITHFRRDMRSLSAMLDDLDQYSLETKRPVTLPLLRELLQRESHDQEGSQSS
ncbi:DnaA regulatory inactivator Hda [Actimicrobium antarcticum]